MGVTGGKTTVETAAAEVGGNCIEMRRNNALEERDSRIFIKISIGAGWQCNGRLCSCRGEFLWRWMSWLCGGERVVGVEVWFWLGRFGGA